MKHLLFRLLQWWFPAERPTDDELIAYGAEQERERQQHHGRRCEVHVHEPLRRIGRIGSGQYECPLCTEKQTGPIERPFIHYIKERHSNEDAGPDTQMHRIVHSLLGALNKKIDEIMVEA
jgi:hypothetical protein